MTSDKKETIQGKMQQLDELVGWFQGDEFQLEEAKAKLKKATDLAQGIERDLTAFTNDITELKQSFQADTGAS